MCQDGKLDLFVVQVYFPKCDWFGIGRNHWVVTFFNGPGFAFGSGKFDGNVYYGNWSKEGMGSLEEDPNTGEYFYSSGDEIQ